VPLADLLPLAIGIRPVNPSRNVGEMLRQNDVLHPRST